MYSYYCLLASYWFRLAWLGVAPESNVPHRIPHARAEFYQKLACDHIEDDFLDERERYHAAYKIWMKGNYSYPHLFMCLHFLSK